MCGIFGLLIKEDLNFSSNSFKSIIDSLFKLSESRGKESSGITFIINRKIKVYKEALPASLLIKKKEYKKLFKEKTRTVIGHTRLVTNGTLETNNNNQPVIKDGLVGVHNGIVVNNDNLWKHFVDLKREHQVDTEIILSLIRMFLKEGREITEAVQETFNIIQGSASVAILFDDINYLLLTTNTGSLYLYNNKDENTCIFSSELYILKKLIKKHRLKRKLGDYTIQQLKPKYGYLINLNDLKISKFSFNQKESSLSQIKSNKSSLFEIIDLSPKVHIKQVSENLSTVFSSSFNLDQHTYSNINSLRRCTRCVLPETMPFIKFDKEGVCNYCHNYKKMEIRGEQSLENFIAPYRNKSGKPDCLVAFSGGRDSSYGLHYIKNVLKMNPIAYSYDWGMVTDLARRNQARICGQLGIEHIIVSADIKKKRENIRKNVLAWLKRPDLGMIPLFMAGDKQYFYYANKLKKQNNLKLIIYSENPLERTHFKNGFCGIKPSHINDKHIFALSLLNKIKLAGYYSKQLLRNPRYFNNSILDSLNGYLSSYFILHDYLFLYQYIKWDEEKINSTLINDYNWELASDTKSTWRIGDGTTSFYNHIYYTLAGFTENDTFRSNQVREGVITREEALNFIHKDNKPRYDSIEWYCKIIGIDFKKTLEIINSAPRLYHTK